jgi:hypothetical protein
MPHFLVTEKLLKHVFTFDICNQVLERYTMRYTDGDPALPCHMVENKKHEKTLRELLPLS